MAKISFSTKRLMIDKANRTMVLVVAIASFVSVFALVASRALLNQRAYQARVTSEKETAVKQLKSNVEAVRSLQTAYQAFVDTPVNVIGGNPRGQGDRDGDNAKIVLDALPSKYDFPALATSLEKILVNQSYRVDSITGTDDELNQGATASSPNPNSVEIPFQSTISGSYASLQTLIATLEKSIRPIQLLTIDLAGSDSDMQLTITAKTFYQPAKSLSITTKDIR